MMASEKRWRDTNVFEDKQDATFKTTVRIRQNAWQAKFAAKCIRQTDVALTISRTIYLSHSSPATFLQNKIWVAHELTHVEQFQRYGTFRFILLYLGECLRKGYFHNKWEVAARTQQRQVEKIRNYRFILCP